MIKRCAILHNIRSAHNVGSVFRSADGAGIAKIFLTGYTPAPVDRFGRENGEIAKTSLGASRMVPYECVEDVTTLISRLQNEGTEIVAVEQTPEAIDYRAYELRTSTAFVFGNEVTGIEKEVLGQIKTHIVIPMAGSKESLNVSVCAGIIFFHYKPR